MPAELQVMSSGSLTQDKRTEIDESIERIIAQHKGNRQEINRLVFESVAAMTAAENSSQELASKSGLKRFLGGITGSNKRLQDDINSNRAIAQYTSQQTLQRLAEQNLMSFDLITAVNNKLNASVVAIEEEFNEVYRILGTFFKQTRSDLIQLENRVERLERNVNLLNWQNSIEYQMFNGMEYPDLDLYSKIVCLVRDFYDISKGQWTTSDLLLLKTAMVTIGISPQQQLDYYTFIKTFSARQDLQVYLFNGKQLIGQPNPTYLALLGGIKKKALLESEEKYIVDSTAELLNASNVNISMEEIVDNLTKSYLINEAEMNVYAQVNCFDFLLETLFNLHQAIEEGLFKADIDNDSGNMDEQFKASAMIFMACQFELAHPLLLDLSARGYTKANALLYWVYSDGYKGCPMDKEMAKKYAYDGYRAGDPLCACQYALSSSNTVEKEKIFKECEKEIVELKDEGDIFAKYLYAEYKMQNSKDIDSEILGLLLDCAQAGFYRPLANIIDFLTEKNSGISFEMKNACLAEAILLKYPKSSKIIIETADAYYNSGNYSNALALYYLADEQYGYISTTLGLMYELGKGVEKNINKAVDIYMKSALQGSVAGQWNIGTCYYEGLGVEENMEKCKYWLKLAAEQGHEEAIKFLKEKF